MFRDSKGDLVLLKENEATVIWYIMTGMTSRRISHRMNVNEKMVSYYKLQAMKKLKVKNRAELNFWLTKGRH